MPIGLLVFIGLPGAGKTRFCNLFRQHMNYHHMHASDEQSCYHIHFDEHLTQELSLKNVPGDASAWKTQRSEILNQVERLVTQLQSEQRSSAPQRNVVILLDDNFYYRSMRKPYYRLAQQCEFYSDDDRDTQLYSFHRVDGLHYVQLGFNQVTLETCLERNAERQSSRRSSVQSSSGYIDPEILHKMNQVIEWPHDRPASGSTRSDWEKSSIPFLSIDSNRSRVDTEEEEKEEENALGRSRDQDLFHQILRTLFQSKSRMVQPMPGLEVGSTSSHTSTARHAFDLRLRKQLERSIEHMKLKRQDSSTSTTSLRTIVGHLLELKSKLWQRESVVLDQDQLEELFDAEIRRLDVDST